MSVLPNSKEADALTALHESYQKQSFWKWLMLGAGFILLMILMLAAVTLGSAELTVSTVFRAIAGKLLPFLPLTAASELESQVIWNLRLPRIVMAVAAGAGLAVSGVIMQGILRNPLVSPFTLGISSAAAFGASIAIIFGVGFAGTGSIIIVGNAFVFALLCAFLVFGMSWHRRQCFRIRFALCISCVRDVVAAWNDAGDDDIDRHRADVFVQCDDSNIAVYCYRGAAGCGRAMDVWHAQRRVMEQDRDCGSGPARSDACFFAVCLAAQCHGLGRGGGGQRARH